jgi:aerobic-type carbon monoxide dehydrogenase small subunit (CoxS/CutS family)
MSATAVEITFTCNGVERRESVLPDRLLIDFLREDLGLTGAKLGCGTGDCGACTVLVAGKPVTSCLIYAVECDGAELETVESVAQRATGRALVDAFVAEGAVQCGICTPGFVVAAAGLLDGHEAVPTTDEVKDALAGNLCRCTGYFPIIEAVRGAATNLAGSPPGEL